MVFKLFNKEQIVILILTVPNKKNNPTEICFISIGSLREIFLLNGVCLAPQ
jgi:hypothetical protein